jgi:hypothetical protein
MQTAVTQLPTNPGIGPLSQLEAEEYLESIRALAQELDRAMEAIAVRELSTFEESLHRQRAACANLADLPRRSAQRRAGHTGSNAAPVDAELAGRISAATTALLTLNSRYSALLKHSGDTMRLFAGLFRSYTGTTQQGMGMTTNLHTWSCEL